MSQTKKPRGVILDGKALAKKIRKNLQQKIRKSSATYESRPGLAAILVGSDPASALYVTLKEKAAKEVGMHFHTYRCNDDISEKNLLEVIDFLNKDAEIHGILVQLPLPKGLDEDRIVQHIDPAKDADGFHKKNIVVLSPPLAATVRFLEETTLDFKGKSAICVVNSTLFGEGLKKALKPLGLRATIVFSDDQKLTDKTKKADVLITAAGKAKLITSPMVKKGAIVIDIGTVQYRNKTVGDVDFQNVLPKTSFITPVPGGIGPMTVAYLLKNTYTLWEHLRVSKSNNRPRNNMI